MMPRSGDVLYIGREASVQFGFRPIRYRVIRVMEKETRETYAGWAWLDGYELDDTSGDAVERRQIFVQLAGLRVVESAPRPAPRPAARPTNTRTPLPRQRATTTTTGSTR